MTKKTNCPDCGDKVETIFEHIDKDCLETKPKIFRVSLGLLKQCNFEIMIEAENEKEAIAKAVENLRDGGDEGEVEDFDGADIEEDFNEEDETGIYVEEANQ